MIFSFLFFFLIVLILTRIHIYLNLHFLEVNYDKNCTDDVEHPRKYGSNNESKAKQQSNCHGQLGSPGRKNVLLRGPWQDLHLSHLQHQVLIIWQWKLNFVHSLARSLGFLLQVRFLGDYYIRHDTWSLDL